MTASQSIRIDVSHAGGSYPILIEPGLMSAAAEHLAPYVRNERLVLVTDRNVWAAQGPRLRIGLAGSRIELMPIILPPGERSKSWPVLTRLVDRLLTLGIERNDTIIAFGGGVIGDLTGFAASIVKRGCNFVQVPTSLLAQVDSSVGGKTGINNRLGKNLVGSFHQPSAVLIDPRALETLPERHVRAGFAEVLKMGLIADADFFAWCEEHGASLIAGDLDARMHAIAASISAKAAIVAEDEREMNGRRQLLNLGHTFGHALEAETGMGGAPPRFQRSDGSLESGSGGGAKPRFRRFEGSLEGASGGEAKPKCRRSEGFLEEASERETLLHGEAVAMGMLLAFTLSNRRGFCGTEEVNRLGRLLRETGLPTDLKSLSPRATGAKLAQHMAHDKKARDNRLSLILARGIGQAFADNSIDLAMIAAFLDEELGEARD